MAFGTRRPLLDTQQMKFRLHFKTPDATEGLSLAEIGDEDTFQKIKTLVKDYVKYGENITIEFDTDKMSVEVLKA
jgi:hypothetical protein